MPGRFYLTRALPDIASALDAVTDDGIAAPPRRNVAPGQEVLTLVARGADERALTPMRWGVIPVGRKNARGRPVLETIVNARGETVFAKSAFLGTGRALVPVDGWYEWTGTKGKKKAWRILPRDGRLLTFAAITDVWTAPGGTLVPQVATVTCPPSPDVAAIHDRMGVIVAPEDRMTWLSGGLADASDLIRPWPAGRLRAEDASDVDFNGP